MRFSVRVRGHNFLVQFDGEPSLHGFYANVVVEAFDKVAAENAAVQVLRQMQKLRTIILNAEDDPPRMFVEEVDELESGVAAQLTVEPGLIWFPQDGIDMGPEA